MKRGHIILISGAALLVAGIIVSAVWGISFASLFVRDNTIVARTSIDPGKSIEAKTDVNELDRSISLAIGIDRAGQQPSSPPSDIRQEPKEIRISLICQIFEVKASTTL